MLSQQCPVNVNVLILMEVKAFSTVLNGSAYLSWMIHSTSDFLGVAFEGSNNFTRVLVKYDGSLVSTTYNEREREKHGKERWLTQCHVMTTFFLPVRALDESPERSKARIPGTLALCKP